MRNKIIVLLLALIVSMDFVLSQEVCESPQETVEDLNSITKCVIDKTEKVNSSGKKAKKLSVKISASTRYLKRRVKNNETVSRLSSLNTSGVSALEANSRVSESLELKEEGANNVNTLMSNISKEQLQNASEFEDVDQIPLFKKCKSSSREADSNCFNEKMMSHIQKHFRYPEEALISNVEGNVWVRFVIDEDGIITNLKTLAPSKGKALKDEAVRVISKLEPFKPALKNGEKVLTKYGFPINFSLEDK